MPNKSITQNTYLEIDGKKIPVKFHLEHRRNIRASMGKKAIHLRMPIGLSKKEKEKHWKWFEDWAIEQFAQTPELWQRFYQEPYKTGDTINIYDRTYILEIIHHHRRSHGAKLKGSTIHLELNPDDDPIHLKKVTRQLISRIVGQDCLPEFARRVDDWNDQYFKESINNIRFKYNRSNWGSCSNNRNLNFSTRLLFAPREVIDYVIVHELAHLKELNHSPRFWKIVRDIMPDYKKKEQWLDENGVNCDF